MIKQHTVQKHLMILLLLLANLFPAFSSTSELKIVNLRTEYTSTPLGMDVSSPEFSWQMQSERHGAHQKAFRIVIYNERGSEVWDTKKVAKSESIGIRYQGEPLQARTNYRWHLQVWDDRGRVHQASSWFETGLMLETVSASKGWHDAQWIGGAANQRVLYSPYLPVFKLDFSIQLDSKKRSTKAGFIYGANDPRLQNRDRNHMGLASKRDSSFVKIVLDVSPMDSDMPAVVNIYRRGYLQQESSESLLKSFPIPTELLDKEHRYAKQRVMLTSVLGQTEIYLNGDSEHHLLGKINLNPLGQGGDFIAYPVMAELGLFVGRNSAAAFSDIIISDYRSPANSIYVDTVGSTSLFADKEMVVIQNGKYYITADDTDVQILSDPSRNAAPMLRKTFFVGHKQVEKARLYASARGIYDVLMNGERITDNYFNPGLTQYNKTHLYQTYDVTKMVSKGENVLGAILGEGWWSGGATYMGDFWNFFGDRPSFLAQLIITYVDGTEEIIDTGSAGWKICVDGPLRYGSFFQGEVYDARKEMLDWTLPTYDDSAWSETTVIALEGNISRDSRNLAFNMPMVDDYSAYTLLGDIGPAVSKVKELTAISVEEVRPGVFLYDMGQNFAGVPRIELSDMKAGTKLTMRFAEVKYPDLAEYSANQGMIMLENIRAAMAQDIYITKGGHEIIAPRFTYHGYRYIEISGLDEALPIHSVKGDVLSSVHQLASSYYTSEDDVNKLWQNITWSTLSNFVSIPTDCPQRNERLGWSGDISVFARTATYLADMPLFLRRHMRAMRDVQDQSGRFPDVAPLGGGFGGVLWGSAGITVPWESYRQYGDRKMLEEHYDAMKKYIDFLIVQIDPKSGVLAEHERQNWGSLGDWLSPEYDKTEKTLLWEAYFIYNLNIMCQVATILEKSGDVTNFQRLYKERVLFFGQTYIDPKSGVTTFREKNIDTQTSYLLPLQFNIVNPNLKSKVLKNLEHTITRETMMDDGRSSLPFSLLTGFIGTTWMNHTLSQNNRVDLAYGMLLNKSYPSWLYPVTQGATTIWERLNSYTHADGFGGNNRMNSFNHYSFGAVGAWMIEHSLGIRPDFESAGFDHFIIAPEIDPTGKLRFAKGYYDSPYGRILSGWYTEESHVKYELKIPPNTRAKLILDARALDCIKLGNRTLSEVKGVEYLGEADGKFAFLLVAGKYAISVDL